MSRSLQACLAILTAAAALGQMSVAPALAMSTAQEVAQGKAESADVDAHSIKVTDPFLVSWVNSIGGQLAQHRQRRDINFTFTILSEPDINAFAMKGGFIHVDMGLLNFVSSNDELAATMGHEMGHVELRHVVKSDAQDNALSILAAIASIISPIAGVLGNIGGELAAERFSRTDELQADHYGMRLAAQSGFDPEAAVDVMAKLGAMDPGPGSKADKAFIDHPVPQDRVAHLLGYPELNDPSTDTIIEEAIHDQSEGRYSYAQAKLKKVSGANVQALVSEHETELDYAMRESGALAAPDSRVMLVSIEPDDPRREEATAALRSATQTAQDDLTQAKTNARLGAGELQNLEDQLNRVSAAMANQQPQGQQQAGPSPTNGPAAAAQNAMARLDADISGSIALIDDVFQTAPGLFGPNQDTLREMSEPLDDVAPLTPKYEALLAYYPAMTAGLNRSNSQILDSIAQARSAIDQGLTATQMLTDMVNATPPPTSSGHGFAGAGPRLPNIQPVLGAWEDARVKAQHASDEMYAAQAMDLSAEITLFDVQSSPERYAAFSQALSARFLDETPPTYAQAAKLGIPPGEIVCGMWYAYDTHEPVESVLENFKSQQLSCEDTALSRHLMGESLEIAEGLVYQDYTDLPEPVK